MNIIIVLLIFLFSIFVTPPVYAASSNPMEILILNILRGMGVSKNVGATGATGQRGIQGIAGSIGSTGYTGMTGPQGAIGLQGIPGPVGVTGLLGPQGATGIKGDSGEPMSLIVFDNNESELGIYAGSDDSFENVKFFNKEINKIISISQITGESANRIATYYSNVECGGTPYTNKSFLFWQTLYSNQPNVYYYLDKNTGFTSTGIYSFRDESGTCIIDNRGIGNYRLLTPISVPFSEPIALPLEVKYE
jgi:hypothetical protein